MTTIGVAASSAPATAAAKPSFLSKFKSILEKVGEVSLKVLHIGETAAVVASPIISATFGPAIGALVSNTAQDVLVAEQAANAAGMQKAGAQKAQAVVQSLASSLPGIEKDFGITVPQEKQSDFVQAIFNLTGLISQVVPAEAAPPANTK